MRVEHDRQRRLQELLRSMRVRILAAIIGLLFASSIVSVVLSRGLLFESLDVEIRGDLVREAEEFRRLASGTDPRTGEPFGTDLRAIFDVYFDREVPDEGETLLAFVDGALQAALGLDGDIAVADPFRPTDGIVQLLRLRATQQLGDRRSTKAARVRRAAACR